MKTEGVKDVQITPPTSEKGKAAMQENDANYTPQCPKRSRRVWALKQYSTYTTTAYQQIISTIAFKKCPDGDAVVSAFICRSEGPWFNFALW